jgi:hypothetical protein
MKYKSFGKIRNEESESLWGFMDLYCLEHKRDLKYYLENKKSNPNSNLVKIFFVSRKESLLAENKNFDFEDFRQSSCLLKNNKTFENKEQAGHLEKLFYSLNMPLPEFVSNCVEELTMRNSFMDIILKTKLFPWSKEEKANFVQTLEKEIKLYTLGDKVSRESYYREMFKSKVEQLKKFHSFVNEDIGFDFEKQFYESRLVAEFNSLNKYFFLGEKKAGTIQAYQPLKRNFFKYVGLKNQIIYLQDLLQVNPTITKSSSKIALLELSIQEFGLKLAFEERQVTIENCDKIVQEIGLKSGGKLYQWYNKYTSRTNRKGKPNPYTLTKLNNKIKTFERVLDFLDEDYKAKAIDELNILQGFRESDFH